MSNPLPSRKPLKRAKSGAVREDKGGKGAYNLIPPYGMRLLAKRFEDGAVKHGRGNWQKGLPLSTYQDAINRHTMQAGEGDKTEDHYGAIAWNALCWAWTENEILAGRLPASLNDLLFYDGGRIKGQRAARKSNGARPRNAPFQRKR